MNLPGDSGGNYVPGRSWEGLAEMLLRLLPPLEIADLGAGEGTLSLLLAQRARRVIAVDSSPKMVEYGAEVAKTNWRQ
jgi:ArsR family transcriptional regulator